MSERELYHYGVKGQQWGKRRYQDYNGSYLPGAQGRYNPTTTPESVAAAREAEYEKRKRQAERGAATSTERAAERSERARQERIDHVNQIRENQVRNEERAASARADRVRSVEEHARQIERANATRGGQDRRVAKGEVNNLAKNTQDQVNRYKRAEATKAERNAYQNGSNPYSKAKPAYSVVKSQVKDAVKNAANTAASTAKTAAAKATVEAGKARTAAQVAAPKVKDTVVKTFDSAKDGAKVAAAKASVAISKARTKAQVAAPKVQKAVSKAAKSVKSTGTKIVQAGKKKILKVFKK